MKKDISLTRERLRMEYLQLRRKLTRSERTRLETLRSKLGDIGIFSVVEAFLETPLISEQHTLDVFVAYNRPFIPERCPPDFPLPTPGGPPVYCTGTAPLVGEWWRGVCNWPGSNWCVRCHREVWDRQTAPAPEGYGMCANGCKWTECRTYSPDLPPGDYTPTWGASPVEPAGPLCEPPGMRSCKYDRFGRPRPAHKLKPRTTQRLRWKPRG